MDLPPWFQPFFAALGAALQHPAQNVEPKTRDPDQFDGTDQTKLQPFLVACKVAFQAQPRRFRTERSRILYMVSFLKGPAAKRFEHDLQLDEPQQPLYLHDFHLFEAELRRLFEDPNRQATAERKLRSLKMKESHHVYQFIINFDLAAAETDWNDAA